MFSKSKVKFSFMTVRSKVVPILKLLEDGEYPSSIAFLMKLSKQNIFYYIKKLETSGLIYQKTRSSFAVYMLTHKGKEFLRGCEGRVFSSGLYRLHNCRVKYPIFREGVYPKGNFREVELVNWTALLGFEQGVGVRKTTRHWIIECGKIYGKNPSKLLSKALNIGNRVAQALTKKYGVLLAEGEVQEGYELAADDPVADFISRYFQVSTPKRKIDHSELKGEIDHLSKDAAIEYLLMPERIDKMEKETRKNSIKLDEIMDNLQSLLALSNQFENLIISVNQLVQTIKIVVTNDDEILVPRSQGNYIS